MSETAGSWAAAPFTFNIRPAGCAETTNSDDCGEMPLPSPGIAAGWAGIPAPHAHPARAPRGITSEMTEASVSRNRFMGPLLAREGPRAHAAEIRGRAAPR